ncbi:hypothetical protein Kpol_2001p53 [Vanderwaltozyma polyspora DSM 70294]|uniref:Ribokinase n=1 Tax=Vanderwaltozyma polyspora (strain ATCC 22028 / DSM 70294 / BCRC 21397 / CBS 2163 / NBRC 10782 / NRRL Y-8283 / UCD 57-17) TaxID=436907 RepID=A7TGT5_VANPO|nr:uncharacterized protein Kpol_2001p53 [Vanderwaltozyma polyspora DSM 70294]EDO18548.1 hypothetical protein Kpol_2001p53 [Vanderwaltozyma polyspora DSM 70294]
MGITIIGSLNYDLVTYTNKIPNAGETIRANLFETHTGGKGLNQTVAIAKLKHPDSNYGIKMVGNVGDDSFGKELVDILKQNNVNIDDIGILSDVKTGIATILVEQQNGGQNRILITEGANGKTDYSLEQLKSIFNNVSNNEEQFVVLQHEIPNPISIMSLLKNNFPTYKIVFNPSPFQPLNKGDWLLIDVLIVNEIEALQIVNSVYSKDEIAKHESEINHDFVKGYTTLCEKFQKHLVNKDGLSAVIITLGSKGVLYSSKDQPIVEYQPAKSGITVVDTTGAGDTFLGAVVTQLHQQSSLKEAIDFATSASSITIQRNGAAESIPVYSEVVSRH